MTWYFGNTCLRKKLLQSLTNTREMSKQGSKKAGKTQKAAVTEVS